MKVDEQFKCKDCDNYNLCKYYHNRRETSFICKEFQNQWGFIKELEKIKAEIIGSCNNIAQEVSDLSYTRKIYVYEQLSEIKGAIDNHISELKGE